MSVTTIQELLVKEIDRLNECIDRKIIDKRSYKKDARTHKLLRAKLEKINKQKRKRIPFSTLLTL